MLFHSVVIRGGAITYLWFLGVSDWNRCLLHDIKIIFFIENTKHFEKLTAGAPVDNLSWGAELLLITCHKAGIILIKDSTVRDCYS